jgi:hypothetical protein
MWTDDALETTMNVVDKSTHSLRRANKAWNIPLSSLFVHLNGKKNLNRWGQKV